MNQALRVLFATTQSYLPQRTGGSTTTTHDLCVELIGRGCTAGVLASLESSGWFGLRTRIRRKLPPRQAFPMDRKMGYPTFRGWRPLEGIPDVVDRFDPSVAVLQAGRVAPMAKRLVDEGVPTTVYLHDVEFERLGGGLEVRPGLCYVANSEFTAKRAQDEFGLDPVVIPPLVRPDAYRTETDRSTVVFVNPHPFKGVDIAFELATRRPDVPFLFVESWGVRDDLREEYTHRARSLPNLTWSPRVSDMREVYSRARLVLVPSEWEEAWGRVPTEAHFSGIPALASTRGGLPESVGTGGILVDPEAPISDWEDALGRLWDDEDEYDQMVERALEYSRRPAIQPENLISRFIEVLREHAASGAQPPSET